MKEQERDRLLRQVASDLAKLRGHFVKDTVASFADTVTDFAASAPQRLTEPAVSKAEVKQRIADLRKELAGLRLEVNPTVYEKIVGNKPEDLAQPNHQGL